MKVTDVIRGDDHLNNTPRQMNMLKALGATPPAYAHVPMILGPDGAKLSKRHGAVSVLQYREEGYLPEALLNYLVRLGWSHGDQEVFTLEEMAQLFDIKDVNKSASAFNPDKLLWLNQQHMMRAPLYDPRAAAQVAARAARGPGRTISSNSRASSPRNGSEPRRSRTWRRQACSSFASSSSTTRRQRARISPPKVGPLLAAVRERLTQLTPWSAPGVHAALEDICATAGVGLGKVAQPLRVAVSGGAVSPPIDATVALLGKETAIRRIDRALEHIDKA